MGSPGCPLRRGPQTTKKKMAAPWRTIPKIRKKSGKSRDGYNEGLLASFPGKG